VISQPRSKEWFDFYNGAFCYGVHQLLAWGYLDARSKIRPTDPEDDITGQIVECIKDRLDDPSTPQEFTQFYYVSDQDPVRRSKKRGKARPVLDIVTTCSIRLPKPEFMHEAKRLKVNGFPIGAYIGKVGMQRFLYGPVCPRLSGCRYGRIYPEPRRETVDRTVEPMLFKEKRHFAD